MSKAESYLPPSQITIKSLASVYLCSGIRSTCWDCECADHCEYGRIFCQMLRERVKKQKHGWRGYELAAAPLIMEEIRRERKLKEKHSERERRRYRAKKGGLTA